MRGRSWLGSAELADAATPERARPVTVPIETASGDRWVSVTGVAFDEGVVYALRDVTDEQALERARSDFVATASHELRTPLAAVYGAARTLRRTDIEIPAEQHDRFLEIIVSETERLTAIVSQILLAGQLEEGRVDVATSATDLTPLVESALDSARLRAPDQIELRLEQNGAAAVALADEDKLRQVLVNLLDNAIKYSPDGGERLEAGLGQHGAGLRARARPDVDRDPDRTTGTQHGRPAGHGLGEQVERAALQRAARPAAVLHAVRRVGDDRVDAARPGRSSASPAVSACDDADGDRVAGRPGRLVDGQLGVEPAPEGAPVAAQPARRRPCA